MDLFCSRYQGTAIRENSWQGIALPILGYLPDAAETPAQGSLRVAVYGRNNVEFTLTGDECRRVLGALTRCYTLARPDWGWGGTVSSNAAV